MRLLPRRHRLLWLGIIGLLFVTLLPASLWAADATPAPATSAAARGERIEAIEKAGAKAGQDLDHLGDLASTHLGAWINERVFNDISWLKLLASLLMVGMITRSFR